MAMDDGRPGATIQAGEHRRQAIGENCYVVVDTLFGSGSALGV